MDPKNVLTNFNLGEFYFEQKEYLKAVEYYEKAHTGFPSNARILFQIGLTYQKLKNFQAACNSYEKVEIFTFCLIDKKAIIIDPQYRKSYINACIIFDKLDDHEKMVNFMQALQTNFPQSSKALNVNAVLNQNFPEKNEDIEKTFKQVTTIDPNNSLNIYNQAVYYYTQNDLEKSSQLFARILADPDLKQMKTHPIRIFSELSISLILERQNQLKNARKHLMSVSKSLISIRI